ncbi:MAG: tRNA (adenosine(37)-N6)-threonylcarbamoyltransferase complex dimerization subunit type 1 TsaB [Planctomycetes bacterium]|nr:tRNA (adenosine(37)-N6)-threonylcarbamoyltransferase complex dimerization subunit type 1 TsaB [Planctomycetota bacterium]
MSAVAVALETSTRTPSVAVECDGRVWARELSSERAHSSDLLPALAELVRECGAQPRDVGCVFVGVGPGSYTGLRVGVATALGLVRANGASILALPSTEVTAYGALEPGAAAAVVLDARSSEVYFALYRRTAEGVECQQAPSVVRAELLAERLPLGARVLADDDAVRAARLDLRPDLVLQRHARPRAGDLLELGKRALAVRGPDRPELVAPLYLRAFAAKSRRR